MGSKSRIAKDIVPIIQKCIDDTNISNYMELFVGGANVIDKIKCTNQIGNDIHKPLIHLLEYAKNGGVLPDEITREEYSKVRSNPNNFDDWYVGCVGFLASYNGRYFDGGYAQSGYEKTKTGERFRNYYQEAKNNLIKQSQNPLFKNTTFRGDDYKSCINIYKPDNWVIYVDPPYQGTKQFSNGKNFNYDEFWKIMRDLSKNNYVLISELNAPNDFENIWEQEVSRSIKLTDKSKAVEKLFTYKNGKYSKSNKSNVLYSKLNIK